ncbi:MAG: Do family serine endopeptidase [Gammaproteobacteria bacterium]
MHNILSIRPVIAALLLVLAVPVSAISETAKQQGIPTLAPMLEKVTPAVVSIRVSKAMPTGSPFSFGGQIPDELRRFLPDGQPQPNQGRQQYATGAGSGVIIDAANGYVVTNHHVIADAASISVQLNDGRALEGELLGSDPNTDIALVQVPADQLTELSFAAIETVDVGDYVVAIGNPFGIGQTVTSGIVSALGRAGLNNEHYEDFIQTDAAINMGNSGGALVDLEGNLVGINTAIISGSGGSNGVGFAVPVDMVTAVIGHLERDGEVRRGLLGVTIADVTPDVAEALELDMAQGALVTSVMPGSAAESAGIEVSDVIVSLGDEAVTGSRDLRNMVGLMRRGEEVALRLYRNGEAMTLNAIIGGPEGQVADSEGRSAQSSVYRGAQLRDLSAADLELADEGVLVVDVQARSRAAAAGLRPGDVIVEVNRRSVADLAAFNAAVEGAERLTAISVIREGRSLLLFVPA